MTLRLKINLIVSVLTLLFAAVLVAQQFDDERKSVREEVVAANRVAAQLLNRMVWEYSSQGPQRLLSYLRGMGRVRSNEITLFDARGNALYRSPPPSYKAGRDAPEWFERLVSPPPSTQRVSLRFSLSWRSASAARCSVSMLCCSAPIMRLNATPMAAASVPRSGGRVTSKRPASSVLSASTMRPSGRTACPTSQKTARLDASSSNREAPTSTTN